MSLFYTQVDIPVKLPPKEKVAEFVLRNTLSDNPDPTMGVICCVGAMRDMGDWRSPSTYSNYPISDPTTETIREEQENKMYEYTTSYQYYGDFHFNPEFVKEFPELHEYVMQLPYENLCGVFILLCANKGSELHTDPWPIRDWPHSRDVEQPSRYNIMMTHINDPKFYIQLEDGSKAYPRVTEDYPVYVFTNEGYVHGADDTEYGDIRIQFIVNMMLNKEKHHELITRSAEKFPENAYYHNRPE